MNKEQMIEIIREKVIMANNPGCKALEEALEREGQNDNCILYNETENTFLSRRDILLITGYKKELGLHEYNTKTTLKVIGLILTLERILVALNKQNEDYAYSNGRIMLLDVRDEENDYHNEIICEWQPNKTLEEQSEETIKTIYDILCV